MEAGGEWYVAEMPHARASDMVHPGPDSFCSPPKFPTDQWPALSRRAMARKHCRAEHNGHALAFEGTIHDSATTDRSGRLSALPTGRFTDASGVTQNRSRLAAAMGWRAVM
jgi:hypothetical protein